MHMIYVHAHGGVIFIYFGVGEQFSCVPHPCFELGKLFPQVQGMREWVNLKVSPKQKAVSGDVCRLLDTRTHGLVRGHSCVCAGLKVPDLKSRT